MDYNDKGYVNLHDLNRIANFKNEALGIRDSVTRQSVVHSDSMVNIGTDFERSKERHEINEIEKKRVPSRESTLFPQIALGGLLG